MRKKSRRRRTGARSHRVPWLAVMLVTASFTVFSGWWLFATESKSRAKELCLDRISVMADRIDELAKAWETRSGPTGKSSGSKYNGQEKKSHAQPAGHDTGSRVTSSPESGARATSKPPAPERLPADPKVEVTPEDQEQLRDLLRRINQPD